MPDRMTMPGHETVQSASGSWPHTTAQCHGARGYTDDEQGKDGQRDTFHTATAISHYVITSPPPVETPSVFPTILSPFLSLCFLGTRKALLANQHPTIPLGSGRNRQTHKTSRHSPGWTGSCLRDMRIGSRSSEFQLFSLDPTLGPMCSASGLQLSAPKHAEDARPLGGDLRNNCLLVTIPQTLVYDEELSGSSSMRNSFLRRQTNTVGAMAQRHP